MTKIRTICVDTLTAIQSDFFMTNKDKPGYDMWRDFSVDMWSFVKGLHKMGFTNVLVLGNPGTGKTRAMKNMPSKTNVWINTDGKNPLWEGGIQEYGLANRPISPYHIQKNTYSDILSDLYVGIQAEAFEDDRIAYLTGHFEEYKQGNDMRMRVKLLGKQAGKMGIEGLFEMCFSTLVTLDGGKPKFQLSTTNNGFDASRTPEGWFPPTIPNDYKIVTDTILENFFGHPKSN